MRQKIKQAALMNTLNTQISCLASYLAKFSLRVRPDRASYKLSDAVTPAQLVSTKLLAAGIADIWPEWSPTPNLSSFLLANDYIWRINNHSTDVVSVYFNINRLDDFFRFVLPKIYKKVVLICADGDAMAFDNFPNIAPFEDPRILAIFTQNLNLVHPNAFPIPLGLDFHSVHQSTEGIWGAPAGMTPSKQELELLSIKRSSPCWEERASNVFYHFSIQTNILERSICAQRMANLKSVATIDGQMPRHKLWEQMAKNKFVASPIGAGLDCHRTWEAIALGCVPIVRRIPAMSPLFANLPVWEVDDYAQVTEDSIQKMTEEIQTKRTANTYEMQKMTVPWWAEFVRTKTREIISHS